MFGSHLSIAGGLHLALIEARKLRMDCLQIFTKNQRQWKTKPLTDEQISLWQQHRRKTKIAQVVSHGSYLINLASPSRQTREKSIALFREELTRCEVLGIQNLVAHPGAHMHEGVSAGIRRVARALNRLHKDLAGLKTITCLEVTAGQGTSLGHRFEHIRRIIDQVKEPQRLGVCLDTAHLLAAGYDLTGRGGAEAVLDQADRILGLDRVSVMHVNDSKTGLGSRVDRHAHIGRGHVSRDAFRVFLTHPKLLAVPKILETPKETTPEGKNWDLVNLSVLRRLQRSRCPGSKSNAPPHVKKPPHLKPG